MFTAESRVMHDRAHEEAFEMRDGVRIERGMPLRSLKLGLSGKTDVVEFRKNGAGQWLPFPVEYKHGKPKPTLATIKKLAEAMKVSVDEPLKYSRKELGTKPQP